MALNDKQSKFVKEYLVDLNLTKAAIRAGYAPKRADATAYNLLRNTEISTAIREEMDVILVALTAARVA